MSPTVPPVPAPGASDPAPGDLTWAGETAAPLGTLPAAAYRVLTPRFFDPERERVVDPELPVPTAWVPALEAAEPGLPLAASLGGVEVIESRWVGVYDNRGDRRGLVHELLLSVEGDDRGLAVYFAEDGPEAETFLSLAAATGSYALALDPLEDGDEVEGRLVAVLLAEPPPGYEPPPGDDEAPS